MSNQTFLDDSGEWIIANSDDFPGFAKPWASSFNVLLKTLQSVIKPKDASKVKPQIEHFLSETITTFRLKGGNSASSPDSLGQFCRGQYSVLGHYLDGYTVHDLSQLDQQTLLECVPDSLRLKLAQLIQEKLHPFLGSKDPFLEPPPSPPNLSSVTICGKTLKIEDGQLDLTTKVVGKKLAHFAAKRPDLSKLSDIAAAAIHLKEAGITSFNFTGTFISDEDIPDISTLCKSCPSSTVILRNTEVTLSSELPSFRQVLELASCVEIADTPAVLSIHTNSALREFIHQFPEKIIWLQSHMLAYQWQNCVEPDLRDRVKNFHQRFYKIVEINPPTAQPESSSSLVDK